MSEDEHDLPPWNVVLLLFLVFVLATGVVGSSMETDKEVLLSLKKFLADRNQVNQGWYSEWGSRSPSPCQWRGVMCSLGNVRVVGVDLSGNNISGNLFANFSALSELSHLDLSRNTISGPITEDLSRCGNLAYLNLSYNMIDGNLAWTGMNRLHVLDLSMNRFGGAIDPSFPAVCSSLKVLNISSNNFNGSIGSLFDHCYNLKYVDLSSNKFTGSLGNWYGRLNEFTVADNFFVGEIDVTSFPGNCSTQMLDLSGNNFSGQFPGSILNCRNLTRLNLWGNKFSGEIPSEIGSLTGLKVLYLGNNSFSRNIPESLLNLTDLAFLDLSRNNFGGEIQDIIGRFTGIKYLSLHSNSYTGGIYSSGILNLTNLVRLELSYNNLCGPLPIELTQLSSLKYLVLAFNQFNGSIPPGFGNFTSLQGLDVSHNVLSGTIPSSIGNLRSLLWLMLANNMLTGEIPPELGNCSSLLWLNLANNQLSGNVPVELFSIGRDPMPTFLANHEEESIMVPCSDECLVMRRWIPVDYPPFNFVYTILSRKTCRGIWDRLIKGIGLFPLCVPGTSIQTNRISGYIQLSGNQLSGVIPLSIGDLRNFSMLSFASNNFNGKLPREIWQVPLMVLNVSRNGFDGEIPSEISGMRCLQSLDLSYNNFSGKFPSSLNNLYQLSNFNISYNPLISGVIPGTGQLATFEKESYLGDPLLVLPPFINSSSSSVCPPNCTNTTLSRPRKMAKFVVLLVLVALTLCFIGCGIFSIILFINVRSPMDLPKDVLDKIKYQREFGSSSSGSSPWVSESVPVIQLVKRAFTYSDIVKATRDFSDKKIIGKGGFGTVYRGMLPDGREVAVKKLQREGPDGEKEFQTEMEVLCGDSFEWPHPNLVPLYGWCLCRSEKILVYKYMEGGSLEDMISDRARLPWRNRIDIAINIARALVFLHHECYPAIVHRDVKASNVLLDIHGMAHVTDFGLARKVNVGETHVSTMVAGTIGYVAPEYGQTWQATTKGDVYSYGVLVMELATARRALDGCEDECLVEWARRVLGAGRDGGALPTVLAGLGLADDMHELLRIGIRCTAEAPQARPNMKEVLSMLLRISSKLPLSL
ncbi:hypothetical protein MLD38_028008 [Melastoma candidum]|uniref:Uncharacterized protein n=1 Tax=Melastoma candidum TaxID=119954 RepID=A0ACB9N122_9MYRT|nr:hypothetical protein MLD38_028008 [Melastoma candidum]